MFQFIFSEKEIYKILNEPQILNLPNFPKININGPVTSPAYNAIFD